MPVAWFGCVSLCVLGRWNGSFLPYFHVGGPAQVVVCRADHVAVLLHQAQFLFLRQVVQLLSGVLAILFAVYLGWLPVSGTGGLTHLVLPAVTLGAALAAILARMTRASVLEELRELYVLAARARGASRTPTCRASERGRRVQP